MVLTYQQGEGNVVLWADPDAFDFHVDIKDLKRVNWVDLEELLDATHLREITEDETPDAFEQLEDGTYRQWLTPHPAVEDGTEWLSYLELSMVA